MRSIFLQWNVSQCVQIWIFNISNTDLFTQTIYLWYKHNSKWICVTFSFQYICAIWLHDILINSVDSDRPNCAPLIADLFFYCYQRDFIANLQKSKGFDLKDKFKDASRYLDDIFAIYNPEFAEYISDIYPRELQLNKSNTSDKETSLLDLNIRGIGSNIHIRQTQWLLVPYRKFSLIEWWCS